MSARRAFLHRRAWVAALWVGHDQLVARPYCLMGAAVKQARSGRTVPKDRPQRHLHLSPLDKARPWEVDWPQVAPLFEACRPYADTSFVYFVGEQDGPVKIGVAKDPVARVRTMQTGNPRRLRVERLLAGDMATEKLLHEFWRPFVVATPTAKKADAAPGTEWFDGEIRDQLFPIVEMASAKQIEFLADPREVDFAGLDRIVREAHVAHDFVAQGTDEVRLLGAAGGYAIRRRSRI